MAVAMLTASSNIAAKYHFEGGIMNIARMEKFEQLWSARHDIPAESLVQYRFESREGYRLPELAAHYRTFVDTLESIVVELPMRSCDAAVSGMNYHKGWNDCLDVSRRVFEEDGLKVAG